MNTDIANLSRIVNALQSSLDQGQSFPLGNIAKTELLIFNETKEILIKLDTLSKLKQKLDAVTSQYFNFTVKSQNPELSQFLGDERNFLSVDWFGRNVQLLLNPKHVELQGKHVKQALQEWFGQENFNQGIPKLGLRLTHLGRTVEDDDKIAAKSPPHNFVLTLSLV